MFFSKFSPTAYHVISFYIGLDRLYTLYLDLTKSDPCENLLFELRPPTSQNRSRPLHKDYNNFKYLFLIVLWLFLPWRTIFFGGACSSAPPKIEIDDVKVTGLFNIIHANLTLCLFQYAQGSVILLPKFSQILSGNFTFCWVRAPKQKHFFVLNS